MSESTAFPSLRNLMESYFNQDFDLYGDDDQAVIAQFRTDSSRGDVDATLVEIDRLLAMPATGLCQLFKSETGRFNVSIGETDADTRDWLLSAREILARPR